MRYDIAQIIFLTLIMLNSRSVLMSLKPHMTIIFILCFK